MVDLEQKDEKKEKLASIVTNMIKRELQGSTVVVESFEADVADEAKFKLAVEKAKGLGKLGRLDIMVCVERFSLRVTA